MYKIHFIIIAIDSNDALIIVFPMLWTYAIIFEKSKFVCSGGKNDGYRSINLYVMNFIFCIINGRSLNSPTICLNTSGKRISNINRKKAMKSKYVTKNDMLVGHPININIFFML